MDKRASLRINNRTETAFGISATVLGALSILLFCINVYITAYHSDGRALIIGFIELVAMLFCLTGLAFGIIGETRIDKFKRTAHIGIGLNVFIGVFHVIVLFQGY